MTDDLGPKLGDGYYDTLAHVLSLRPSGYALEFGVESGHILRMIADVLPVIGFDSFEGLPEDWRAVFPACMFACDPPDVPNASLVAGWFEDSLPNWSPPDDELGLVHIDCDLYSSTVTVLEHLKDLVRPGTYIVFDEY